jgi:hypothetical protein
MRKLLIAAVVLASAIAGWATPASAAPGPVVLRYTFDSGLGGVLAARSSGGGSVQLAGGVAAFPARCAPAKSRPCPRAILQTPDHPVLNPGTRTFHYGATLRLLPGQTSAGSNVVQKGYADSRSQWKLQIDGFSGLPSCVLVGRGSSRVHLVRAAVTIADGRWHRVTCWRGGGRLAIVVDGVTRGQAAVPAGLAIGNDMPVRIGGKNPQQRNDQFHGQLDEVHYALS